MGKLYITGAKRTAIGGLSGALSSQAASRLGGEAIRAALAQAENPAPDEVVMGNVLMAGQGQAPARQAARHAGLDWSVPATTVNKMCGSGMQAAMMTADRLMRCGGTGVAGGMESMSRAPHLVLETRKGFRMGHRKIYDSMFLDGLEDAYEPGTLMGVYAERTAQERQISREAQDEFALSSLGRARAASEGAFRREIVPVAVADGKSETTVQRDEQLAAARPDKIPHLKPAFVADGTVTAANSSSISDGAAALVLQADAAPPKTARAEWMGQASHSELPNNFTVAPIGAIQKLLDQTGWGVEDVDLFEVNEAFAVVALAVREHFSIDAERFNVHGGACALGHPIGASAARVIVTLLGALEERNLKRGVASVCIGGGEATAIAVTRV
ncbi:MAG: thiolase family protein [Hyphomicrobiales bacterium]|nr:thiolase family protein [Hyphomicrobiales bacterium]MCY4048597.1 thiolase family protein [Hyphomicrobiales bacterium]